jgi:hypothetical protein
MSRPAWVCHCRWMLVVGATVGLLAGAALGAGDTLALDPGGVSMDFTGCGVTAVTGPDLLRNGGMEQLDAAGKLADWQPDSYVWLAVADATLQTKIEQRIKPLLQWSVADTGAFAGQRAARLAIPPPAFDATEPPGHEFCAMLHQRVVLPPLTQPTRFVLTYRQRGWSGQGMPNCRAYVRITFFDSEDPAQAKQTRVYDQTLFAPGAQWRPGQLQTTAPQSTRVLDVRIALTGVGEVLFDDVALHQAQEQDAGLSARLMPGALLDNRYVLSRGDLLTMIFGFRNGDGRPLAQPQLVLRLPAQVEVLETAPALPQQTQPAADGLVERRFDLTPIKGNIRGSDFPYPWHQWGGLCLFVRTSAAAGTTLPDGSYWLEDGATRSETRRFALQVTPGLPAVAPPKLFRSGIHPFLIWSASRPETVAGFGQTCRQVGLNCVHCPPSALGDELGRRGFERFTQPLANGYTMGGDKPDAVAYRDMEGKPVPGAICPTEVYRRGAYFQSAIVGDMLRKLLVTERRADQLMCNWEPYMYVGKGCFCDRCKAEFQQFSKLPAADVDATWPRTVASQHAEVLRAFRRWQHAQFVATVEETVQALGKEAGREMHFIPELHYVNLTADWAKLGDSAEFAAVDYLDKLAAVNAWGPYNWYVFGRGPYEYVRGLHLNCHATALQVRDFLRERLPADRQPALYAFPYGTYEGATEPEAIAFELLTYFLDGYRGALVYLFPGGYDARHWLALGDANTQIARFESFVMQGQRPEGSGRGFPAPIGRSGLESPSHCSVQPVTPLPPPDPRFLQSGCMGGDGAERWQNASLLQSWEFTRDGERLLAVGNFWERGECFFKLKVTAPAGQYLLREPLTGRVYGAPLTAAQLSQGVLLHVGALRVAWFTLEPYRTGTKVTSLVRPDQMQTAMKERLPAIRKAADL